MAKSITIDLSSGQLSCIKIATAGFGESDLTKNGNWVAGLHTFIAFSNDETFYLRILDIGLVIHLVDITDVELNNSPVNSFTEITDLLASIT